MRNFLIGLLAGILLATSHLYPMSGIITAIDREADTVAVTTNDGNIWEFYGAEDWCEGDLCAMMMNDCGTPEIYDDIIVSAQYCGYVK